MGADPDVLDPVIDELAGLQRAGQAVVLVHGGGPDIDRALLRQGVQTSRIAGLRVTDAATLEVTEAVLCATLNKRLVRALTRAGSRVAGVSGQDGGTLVATKTQAPDGSDLGFVGTVIETDPALLFALLHAGFLPVVSPLALSNGATHAYNVNADAAAAAIAGALDASALVMLTDVPRVLGDPGDPLSSIHRLSLHDAIAFVERTGLSRRHASKTQRCYYLRVGESRFGLYLRHQARRHRRRARWRRNCRRQYRLGCRRSPAHAVAPYHVRRTGAKIVGYDAGNPFAAPGGAFGSDGRKRGQALRARWQTAQRQSVWSAIPPANDRIERARLGAGGENVPAGESEATRS